MPRQEFLTTDLQQPIRLQELKTDLFQNDEQGNTISVVVTNGGADYTIVGNVVCYMIRPDTTTITINGTAAGGQASVTLPKEAYLYTGRASFVIKAEYSGNKVTLAAFTAIVYRDRSDRIVDNDRIIPSVSEIMEIVDQINNMTAQAQTLPAGSQATAQLTSLNGHYNILFGVPRGINGAEPDLTEATLTAAGWSSDDTPTQTLTVQGISADSHLFVTVRNTITDDQYLEASLAWILCTSQGTNTLEFTAYGIKPAVDIPIIIANLSESGDDVSDFTHAEVEAILDYVFGNNT